MPGVSRGAVALERVDEIGPGLFQFPVKLIDMPKC
jgi:hypothetical protein